MTKSDWVARLWARRAENLWRLGLAIGLAVGSAGLAGEARASWGACSRTALMALVACNKQVQGDYFQRMGVCANESEDRDACREEARQARAEERELCRDQFAARRELCERLGEAPYDPEFEPEDFESDFTHPSHPNPYWPLGIGDEWTYEGGGETVHVRVLPKTKEIEGVTCIVVNDRVEEDGDVKEDTEDWYGLSHEGAVHYCGEMSREFEHFPGDVPPEPELVGIEGSWKAGNDGQKSGIVMPASPEPGQVYRQEWAFLEAEDVAEVLSDSYRYGEDEDLDADVPEDLARALCDGDCVVTRETTAIEPDLSERKFYAPGIGLFLEVDDETGDAVQLIGCNVHPACASLPTP